MKNLILIVLTALFSSLFSFYIFQTMVVSSNDSSIDSHVKLVKSEPTTYNVAPLRSSATTSDFVNVATDVTPSCVYIKTFSNNGYSSSSGSGVVVSRDGYIITNYHVVDSGSSFEVSFKDKTVSTARLVGVDPTTDLAVIKVNERGLQPISFGNSDNLEVGEWVLAIGNPFNLEATVTAGIVSAKGRNINILKGAYSIESFIQTDAVVNPGNSGGALVNAQGQLVGINSAIISQGGSYEGYSFAIPSDLVQKVMQDIVSHGSVKRAVLGVGIRPVNSSLARQLGLDKPIGVYIESVTRNGSADRAGIQVGDVILRINGRTTDSIGELQEEVGEHRPGEAIDLELYRNGRTVTKSNVRLKELGT